MSVRDKIYNYVSKQINILVSQKDTSAGKAQLANLRRGVGKVPGELPELWGMFLNDLDEDLLSTNGKPTYAEWSIYLSLTMFALHQQGNGESVAVKDKSLGKAAAELMNENTDEERNRILRRFGPVVTAKDMYELSHHLRSLVQLMKATGVGLDYVKLAVDIYDFQCDNIRKKVQLKWGQDFYYNNKKDEKGE